MTRLILAPSLWSGGRFGRRSTKTTRECRSYLGSAFRRLENSEIRRLGNYFAYPVMSMIASAAPST